MSYDAVVWVMVIESAVLLVALIMIRNLWHELEISEENLHAWENWHEEQVRASSGDDWFFSEWEAKNKRGIERNWG